MTILKVDIVMLLLVLQHFFFQCFNPCYAHVTSYYFFVFTCGMCL